MKAEDQTKKIELIKELLGKKRKFEHAMAIVNWEQETVAPPRASAGIAALKGFFAGEIHEIVTSKQMTNAVETLFQNQDALSLAERRMVALTKKENSRSRKIPKQMAMEFAQLTSEALAVWVQSKRAADYPTFAPYLEKIVDFQKRFADLYGYEEHPYNALIDVYEPGMTVAILDKVFPEIEVGIRDLLATLQAADKPIKPTPFAGEFPAPQQEALGKEILAIMGFDMSAGRLDAVEHPFCSHIGPGDVRLTTHYDTTRFSSSMFSCLHEGGHGIYEQNLPTQDLGDLFLDAACSLGIHESQSRFFENMIGRSKAFLTYLHPVICRHFPQMAQVTPEDLFVNVNRAQPSLIRTEADELTYSLHVIIRYELEKALLEGKLNVRDLPEAWNEKYHSSLGVVPQNAGEGVLQDVHWALGAFGYFPTYALGNVYGAQFLQAIKRDLPDFESLLSQGQLAPIKAWLVEHIHSKGNLLNPVDLVQSVTGEPPNPQHFLSYLRTKFLSLHRF